ncbi:hypothetical protein NCAS_0C03230 [Naumovozyma castellii]|uniref:U6 snRNA phosphodiesterase n=1 Tax=Naumovozyma castellii TaxID=27288 RepID=G0VCV2_NAUCA|nr:hypothetical protein NCAS_0C03230 [Naumovozyma castellii CBS 4309]CCC69313.1 hypothetical protein NCAS_0C03230 [Naumovozyma castellii CBS 4309]
MDSSDTEDDTLPTHLPESIAAKYHLEPSISKYDQEKEEDMSLKPLRWATFIYIEWRPLVRDRKQLLNTINIANEIGQKHHLWGPNIEFEPSYLSSLGSPRPLHITLASRLNCRSQEQRDQLYEALRAKVAQSTKVIPFRLELESTPVVVPSDRSGTLFLVLPVTEHLKQTMIKWITDLIQQCAIQTGVDTARGYRYELELPHVTIAMANKPTVTLTKRTKQISAQLAQFWHGGEHVAFDVQRLKFDKNRQALSIALKGNA